ncbi:unnamed protein product [Pedinophyceae sp. YPF-701]|nr:unnamed protein product [Pedinophyceae sp. YPF-701]
MSSLTNGAHGPLVSCFLMCAEVCTSDMAARCQGPLKPCHCGAVSRTASWRPPLAAADPSPIRRTPARTPSCTRRGAPLCRGVRSLSPTAQPCSAPRRSLAGPGKAAPVAARDKGAACARHGEDIELLPAHGKGRSDPHGRRSGARESARREAWYPGAGGMTGAGPKVRLDRLKEQLRGMGHDVDDTTVVKLLKEMGLLRLVDVAELEQPGAAEGDRASDAHEPPAGDSDAVPNAAPSQQNGAAEPEPGPKGAGGKSAICADEKDFHLDGSFSSLSGSLTSSIGHSFRYSSDENDPYDILAAPQAARGAAKASGRSAAPPHATPPTGRARSARAAPPGLLSPEPVTLSPEAAAARLTPSRLSGKAVRVPVAPATPRVARRDGHEVPSFVSSAGSARRARASPRTPATASVQTDAHTPPTAASARTVRHPSPPSTPIVPGTSVIKVHKHEGPPRTDRVARWQKLNSGWKKDPFLARNGATGSRLGARPAVKRPDSAVPEERYHEKMAQIHRMMDAVDRPRSANHYVPNSYVTPDQKRRDSLRWEVRKNMMMA